MNLGSFLGELDLQTTPENLLNFCRKYLLNGTPFVFSGNDEKFYEFRKRIALNFDVPFHEVYITGSAKQGFSYIKGREFDYDSDIDVAIISTKLFDRIMLGISSYQMKVKENRGAVSEREMKMYHKFLEYIAVGWVRPDLLPTSFQADLIKTSWFYFFESISNDKSEVGNYKVNAGIFQSYQHLEAYLVYGLEKIKAKRKNKKITEIIEA